MGMRFGFAKKSLGQNFLNAPWVADKAVDAGEVTKEDTILEIGPGRGALTKILLEKAGTVIALEKDRELIPVLQKTFEKEIAEKRLILLELDALDFKPSDHNLTKGKYKLIANIPYYITGALTAKFTSDENHPSTIVFLVQKEVAQRIVAKDNKESILSLSVKAYGQPEYIATVSRGCFTPAPNVDSALLKISSISKDFFVGFSEQFFFEVIKKAFLHKRKRMLQNIGLPKELVLDFVQKMELDINVRAEDVPLSTWGKICAYLTSLQK